MTQTKIIDESGDRKYFTQIPNMIVNHSTAYEQSLYLIMKRLAGEKGSCYASLNFLAEKMKVHKTTVSKTITKLLKRRWIEEIEEVIVRGGKVRQFIVVDIWPQNIKEYEGGAGMASKESGAHKDRSGAVVDGGGAQSDTKKNQEEKLLKKNVFSFNKITDYKIGKRWGEKPYFRGEEMRWVERKGRWRWEVIPKDGGRWLEFAGKEQEIEWRDRQFEALKGQNEAT